MCSVAKSCPTLWDPMDCSRPGSSVHGTLQARILEWAAISFFRWFSRHKDWTHASCRAGGFFTTEPPGTPHPIHSSCGPRMLLRWVFCSSLPITPGVVLTGTYPLWDARLPAPLGMRGGLPCLTHVTPSARQCGNPMTCSPESWNCSWDGLPCLSSRQAEKSPRRESTPNGWGSSPSQNQFLWFFSPPPTPNWSAQLSLLHTLPTAFSSAQVSKTEASRPYRPSIRVWLDWWCQRAHHWWLLWGWGQSRQGGVSWSGRSCARTSAPATCQFLHCPPRTRSAAPPRAPPAGPPGRHRIRPEGPLVTHPHPHHSPVSQSDAWSETWGQHRKGYSPQDIMGS